MRRPHRCGVKIPSGEMRAFALAPCKNGGEPQSRQWAFVSARLDEAPRRTIYEMSGESSWWIGDPGGPRIGCARAKVSMMSIGAPQCRHTKVGRR
jgi:hypothetical protein